MSSLQETPRRSLMVHGTPVERIDVEVIAYRCAKVVLAFIGWLGSLGGDS